MLTFALAILCAAPLPVHGADSLAISIVDTALARMGGADNLARIERVRREMLTQWLRISFADRPFPDGPSYELHTDTRDYSQRAWRNERKFGFGDRAPALIDIVLDTVAIRQFNGPWAPLNVAYVDERRELFTFAPERLLLLARSAPDLRAGADTLINGRPHARLTATVEGFPATLFIGRGDGLPAMARFRAAAPNDFGLVPWGEMEVEFWYSRWAPTEVGAILPTQWDIRRVGEPYKRMTVLGIAFDTVATAETFAVSDSLRAAYFASATKPMHDVPLDSARVAEGRFAIFAGIGSPAGAVKLGGEWVLLETGQAPLSANRALAWLARHEPAPIAGAVVTFVAVTNGGSVELARRGIPLRTAPGAVPILETILRNHGSRLPAGAPVAQAEWLSVGSDSLWLEPIDLPDASGSLLVYSPTLKWVYSASAFAPLQRGRVLARIRSHGWAVERIGSARGIVAPVPAETASAPGGR